LPKKEPFRPTYWAKPPGRYVGAEDIEDDGEPFEEKMQRLVATLDEQFTEGERLETAIRENMQRLDFGTRISGR
jgi:type I restriction enzyme M protein